MSQTYSLTRALALVKSLTIRIQTTADEFRGKTAKPIIGVARGAKNKTPVDGRFAQLADAENHYRSNMQSYRDMVEQRRRLKSKINLANSTTTVVVNNKSMTIADALDLKNEVLLRQSVLSSVRQQHLLYASQIEADVVAQEVRINEQVKAASGSMSESDSAKTLRDTYVSADKEYRQLVLVDPNNITAWIESETKEITAILDEIDYVLSEVNAKTVIEL